MHKRHIGGSDKFLKYCSGEGKSTRAETVAIFCSHYNNKKVYNHVFGSLDNKEWKQL